MRYSEMKALENERYWRMARLEAEANGTANTRAPRWLAPLALIILGVILIACSSPSYRAPDVEMTTNGPVDLERYQGRWYEIARFPNRFEEGCVGVTADYSLNEDGSVKVVNTCRQGTLDGPVEVAEGVATSNSPDNDKLLVTFVPWLPFAKGDYWILDTDYEVAVIGSPSGSTGWVLARTPSLPPQRLARAFQVLEANGYDLNRITMTKQQQ